MTVARNSLLLDLRPAGAGSNLVDFSGRRNHFSFVSPVPQHIGSARGHAIQIVTNGYAALEPNPNVAGLEEMTVLAWVRDDAANQVGSEFTMTHGGTLGTQRSWILSRQSNNQFFGVEMSANGSAFQKIFSSGGPFTPFDGTWHQIGFSFNGRATTNGLLDMWMDGRRVDVFNGTPTDNTVNRLHNSTSQLRIGLSGDGFGPAGGHQVQSVKMWNRALSGPQVRQEFAETFRPSI